MEPTISIANSSHVDVLNNYLQEENICLLSQHVGPSMRNAKLRGTSNLNQLASRYARVKYRSGEFSWTVSNGGAL